MAAAIQFLNRIQSLLEKAQPVSDLAPLLFRLILAWVFFWAGYQKLINFENVTQWFESMGYPLPALMLALVMLSELLGGLCLLFGVAVRWWAVPLMVIMLVAIFSVHWENGWYTIAQSRFDSPPGWASFLFAEQNVQCRVMRVNEMIEACGDPAWVTQGGRYSVVLLQSGIQMAALYFTMLLSLFFTGAGKVSFDHFLRRGFRASDAAAGDSQ